MLTNCLYCSCTKKSKRYFIYFKCSLLYVNKYLVWTFGLRACLYVDKNLEISTFPIINRRNCRDCYCCFAIDRFKSVMHLNLDLGLLSTKTRNISVAVLSKSSQQI